MGSHTPSFFAILAIRLSVPVHLSYILNLVHADHFLLPLSVYTEAATERGILGDGRRAHAQTRKIFVMKAVAFRRSEPQLRGYQIQPEGATHLYTAWEASTLPSSALLALTDISWLNDIS